MRDMDGNRRNVRAKTLAGEAAAMREFDGRKFDFITKLSNAVQLEY